VVIADGDHHAAADRALIEERLRRLGRRGSDDDRVERRRVGPAAVAIADAQLDRVVAEMRQHVARARRELVDRDPHQSMSTVENALRSVLAIFGYPGAVRFFEPT
jgi:hypothetical protein